MNNLISKNKYKIPKEVSLTMDTLQNARFEAYLVGGCVRDILLGKKPKDWDITTNAKPEDIITVFPKTHYENRFGTVGVVNEETEDETLKVIEITTYRIEGDYSDKRRPDEVKFSKNIEDDLKRRDFTINAMALSLPVNVKDISKGHLIDLFGGENDLKKKLVRSVLSPTDRFNEDALRIVRAIRFVAELDFQLEKETEEGIKVSRENLKEVSEERIRDEFERILMSHNIKSSLELAKNLGILEYILPELLESVGVSQKGTTHKYDVWEHSIRTAQAAADKGFSLEVRLAALFHDIAKPKTRREPKDGEKTTFYGHDVVGERVTRKTLNRLKFPKKVIEKVTKLVRWHMFFSDTDEITHSAVRRLISNVGGENVRDLINLRICDRIGTGRPKEEPYRLRKYQAMIEEVIRDPVSVGALKIDGNDLIKELFMKPGPKIGYILHALLDEVLEDPKLNNKKYLKKRVEELLKLSEKELIALGKRGKVSKEQEEKKEIEKIRGKYHVE